MTHPIVLIADPQVLAIPVQDNQELLVDIRNQHILMYGTSPEVPNNMDYTKLRATVLEKILQAQTQLPVHLRFCLYEGYRSLELQQQLFQTFYQKIVHEHPDWQPGMIFRETTKLVAPVTNLDGTKNVPPHSTGAAVDLYLVDMNGTPVDMGIHPADWLSDLEGKLSLTDSGHISPAAKAHRTIMAKALSSVGFINYPTEYWHWSYGDRYWAYHTNNPFALYGTI